MTAVPKFNTFDEFLLWHAQFQAEQAALNAAHDARLREADARLRETEARWQAEAEVRKKEAEAEAEKRKKEAEAEAEERKQEAEERKREAEKREAEAEKSRIEAEKRWRALEQLTARTEKQIGELGNSLGFFTQSLVEPEICNHFQARGFNVSSSYTNRKVKVNGQVIAEIDLTVENGDTTVLIEVKTTLREVHVDEHIARITAVQQANVVPYAGKKLMGALAAITVPESVERYAIKAGFFVLYPVEEIVGVVNGDDFVPRVWEPIS